MDLWDNNTRSSSHVTGVLEGERKEQGWGGDLEKIIKEIIVKCFQIW